MGESHTTVQQITFANRLQTGVGHPMVTIFPSVTGNVFRADAAPQEKDKGGDRR